MITAGSKSQSGGANISGIGGTLESETASEVRGKVVLTDAAKFDELYKTGVMSMMNLENNETIPLICESESTEGYKFIVELSKSFLRMDVTNLNGEMTLFGKAQKIIPEGVEVEVYNMFSSLKTLMEIGNQDGNTDTEQFIEKVTGPAMKIIPLAIYR